MQICVSYVTIREDFHGKGSPQQRQWDLNTSPRMSPNSHSMLVRIHQPSQPMHSPVWQKFPHCRSPATQHALKITPKSLFSHNLNKFMRKRAYCFSFSSRKLRIQVCQVKDYRESLALGPQCRY